MNLDALLEYVMYGLLGVSSFVLWWAIYEWVLTRGLSTRQALFGDNPNTAVALDFFGGFLAIGILNYSIINAPPLEDFWLDVEATALELLGLIVLLGLLRMLAAGFLRLWFGQKKDAQGELISLNNELFGQRNLATGLFSTALYLILVAGLLEVDLLNFGGYRLASLANMGGVWLAALAAILLHSWLFLGFAAAHHILHESFHDNHPAAPTSLLGMLAGVLLLNHLLIGQLPIGEHIFMRADIWGYLLLAVVSVLLLRLVLTTIFRLVLGVNLRMELVGSNAAWGIVDAGLIFGFFLIFTALID